MDEAATETSKWKISNKRCLNGAEKDDKGENDEEEQVEDEEVEGDEEEQCDAEVWERLSKSFKQVQSVLDQNRALIQQVNENHQSNVPDNMTKNVALIFQINVNISKVLNMYSDLSVNFSNIVQQRRETMETKNDEEKVDMENK